MKPTASVLGRSDTLTAPVRQVLVNPTSIVHWVCDDCDIAICGAPLNGIPRDSDLIDCSVCAELGEDAPCSRCGR